MTTTILPTRNEAWGFFGTSHNHADADQAWHLAFTAIAEVSGASPEGIRDFLDSRIGRHFADDVVGKMTGCGIGLEAAIGSAIRRWQGWRIDRKTEREHGITAGLPYLAGWVQHFAVTAAMEDAN